MTDDSLSWETIDSRISYTCPGFDVVTDDVRLPDGTETTFDYLSEPPAVILLPFTSDDDVVIIEEWRQAVGRINRGLPVGSVEADDESLIAAARRELREETGYEGDEFEQLTTVEPMNGAANSVYHIFVAEGCEPTAEQDLDHNESIRVDTTTFEALHDAIANDEIRDGRTVLAVLRYALVADERNP
ncbi:NUDIX hydrolase [Natranaeroarchaeum aerophilus]|uniref:NUDIX hydrolase n=1 Tax=Natranaeroarchaeum aerophilus TaxID=2917711 RepID=A0AAE3FS78_9EURY|nr:NUDIX hydrolase [Natranaeroarchaeum aerophilus]